MALHINDLEVPRSRQRLASWCSRRLDQRLVITKGASSDEVAARRLMAARVVFHTAVGALPYGRNGDRGHIDPEAVRRDVLDPLRVEDPYVLEALRLDWGSRASIQLALIHAGFLGELSERSILGRTLAFDAGPVHGPLFRPSQPGGLPALLEFPYSFAAQQAFVRYLHAVVLSDGPKQIGEHPPSECARQLVDHLARWRGAADVLAYDEVARDAYAWPFAHHVAARALLNETAEDVAAVLERSPELRDQQRPLRE